MRFQTRHFSLTITNLLVWGVLLGSGCNTERVEPAALQLSSGKDVVDATGRNWEGITKVWYYRPPNAADSLQAVMVIHGGGRDGEDYLESWIPIAETYGLLVIAPEFSDERLIGFVGSVSKAGFEYRFNTGNVVSWFSRDIREQDWYFTSIERVFEATRRAEPRTRSRYVLFGHSAGGQFVHRMALFTPRPRFAVAIAANSGWYTLPDMEMSFPYGLSGAPYPDDRLAAALKRTVIVFLGTEDSPDDGGFRTRSEAMEQGQSRQERGVRFYNHARRVASSQGVPLGWELAYAEGIGHDKAGMAKAAVPLLQRRGLLQSPGRQ